MMKPSKPFLFTAVPLSILLWLVVSWVFMWPPVCWEAKNLHCHNACINNLRIIDAGKEQWTLANGKSNGAIILTNEINQYIKGLTTPICPEGGNYTYNPIGTFPVCTLAGQWIESKKIRVTFFTWEWQNGVKPHREPNNHSL